MRGTDLLPRFFCFSYFLRFPVLTSWPEGRFPCGRSCFCEDQGALKTSRGSLRTLCFQLIRLILVLRQGFMGWVGGGIWKSLKKLTPLEPRVSCHEIHVPLRVASPRTLSLRSSRLSHHLLCSSVLLLPVASDKESAGIPRKRKQSLRKVQMR